MKDKPTTRRPPAGPGMDDPDPLGSGAALVSPEALTGPTCAPIQCDSQPTAQVRTSPGFVACLVGIEVASVHLRLRVELRLVPLCEAALPPTNCQVINHRRAVGT